jgi:hypothetical protein
MKHNGQFADLINPPTVGDGIDPVVPALLNAAIDADIELRRILNRLSQHMNKIDGIHTELMHTMADQPYYDEIMTKLELGIQTHMIHTNNGVPYLIRMRMDKDIEPRWWLSFNEIKR